MKAKTPPRMSTIQWFVSIAAGLAMFLLPQDAQSYFSDVYRQLYVAVVAFGIAFILLLLFKQYEPIGVAMLSSMFFTVVMFAIRIGIRIYEGSGPENFTMAVNVYDGLSWGLVWSMPLLCCFLMRIFAQENWNEPEAKRDFCYFFQKASVASGCYLLILLLAVFLYFRPMNLSGMRQLSLIPFAQISRYIQVFQEGNPDGMKLFFSDVIFFIPIGFFLSALTPAWKVWKRLLVPLILVVAIEAFQYALNTGVADIDDVICSMAGFGLGCFVKFLLDRIRRGVTKGKEMKICYVWESRRGEHEKGTPDSQTQKVAN